MPRVSVDSQRVRSVGLFLKTLPECQPSDWTFEGLPRSGDLDSVDYFFLSVKHQYGFWIDDSIAFLRPMYAQVNGRMFKGSDFVWNCLLKAIDRDRGLYNMERQSGMSDSQILDVFSDDEGRCPLPMASTHCELWRAFARDFLRLGLTPKRAIEECRRKSDPIRALMDLLAQVGGYKEDPLAKKASLLAVILAHRPERFLMPDLTGLPLHSFSPIVDYHIQRSALRVGLVRINDAELEARVRSRKILTDPEEREIRGAVYEAMDLLVDASEKTIASLDWFFFQNRRRCPEMTEPDCARCEIQSVCRRRTDLFQPLIRTTYYSISYPQSFRPFLKNG